MRMKRLCAVCLVAVLLAALPCLQVGAGAAEPPAWPGVEVVELKAGQELELAPGTEVVVRMGRIEAQGELFNLTTGTWFQADESGSQDVLDWQLLSVRFTVCGRTELRDESTRQTVATVNKGAVLEMVAQLGKGISARLYRVGPASLTGSPADWRLEDGTAISVSVFPGPLCLKPSPATPIWYGGRLLDAGTGVVVKLSRSGLEVSRLREDAVLPVNHLLLVPPGKKALLQAAADSILTVRPPVEADSWGTWMHVTLQQGDVLSAAAGTLLVLTAGSAGTAGLYWNLNRPHRPWAPTPIMQAREGRSPLSQGSLLLAVVGVWIKAWSDATELLVRGPCAVNSKLPVGWADSKQWQPVLLKPGETLVLGAGAEAILAPAPPDAAVVTAGPSGGLADLGMGQDLGEGSPVPSRHLLLAPRGDGRGILAGKECVVWVRGPCVPVRR